jgi:hypothetical protein
MDNPRISLRLILTYKRGRREERDSNLKGKLNTPDREGRQFGGELGDLLWRNEEISRKESGNHSLTKGN